MGGERPARNVALKKPVHESDLDWTIWYAGTAREIRGKALCDAGGAPAKVGVGLCELPAGSDTTPAHYHTREEEHLYALSGEATLVLGDQEFALYAGSYVCFPAGQALHHHLVNRSSEVFRYLMVGERLADDEVKHA